MANFNFISYLRHIIHKKTIFLNFNVLKILFFKKWKVEWSRENEKKEEIYFYFIIFNIKFKFYRCIKIIFYYFFNFLII